MSEMIRNVGFGLTGGLLAAACLAMMPDADEGLPPSEPESATVSTQDPPQVDADAESRPDEECNLNLSHEDESCDAESIKSAEPRS